MADTVMQSIKWGLVWVFVNENVELLSRNAQIRLIELISINPSKRSVKSSFLDDSVEEKQSE